MAIKYVLFDFDGTLVDSNEAVVSMLHLASMKHRGIPFSPEELNEILGKPIHAQMAFLSEDRVEELVSFYRSEYRKVRDELTKAYEGMAETLMRLKRKGYKIGIVSNKGRNGIDHGLDMFDLHQYIDVSISKDDVTHSKPHPEGIFKALEALGADEKAVVETVFVGDSGHDIECGKNAGCKTVLVDWTLIDKALLLPFNPDFLAKTPKDIALFVESFEASGETSEEESSHQRGSLEVTKVEPLEKFKYLKGYAIHYKTKSGKAMMWELASRGSQKRLEAEIFKHQRFSDGTIVFATDKKHETVVLLKEFRVSAGRFLYMLPAGLMEEEEDPSVTAVREFKEETGLTLTPVRVDEPRYISIGMINESATVVYGYYEGEPTKAHQEDQEDAEIVIVDREMAIKLLKEEEVTLRTALLLEHFFHLNPFFTTV